MILPIFPENCMKLKEFGPPGGGARPKFYYVDPPLLTHLFEKYLYKNQWLFQDFLGGRQPEREAPNYYSANIWQKLHKNEENWTEGGGAHPEFYYVEPPLIVTSTFIINLYLGTKL